MPILFIPGEYPDFHSAPIYLSEHPNFDAPCLSIVSTQMLMPILFIPKEYTDVDAYFVYPIRVHRY